MKTLLTLACALALNVVPALADNSVSTTLSLHSDGAVRVENISGSIDIEVWDKAEIQIDADLHKRAELVTTGDETHRIIKVKKMGGGGMGPSDLRLRVPATARVDASGVSAEIVIRGPRGKRLVAESVSGDVDVVSSAQRIDLESVSGDVDLEAGDSGRVSVSSVSGDVNVRDVTGEVRAESVSGDIEVMGKDIERVGVETVSGDIELELKFAEDSRLDAELLSGEFDLIVDSDLSARIEAETFSGSINTAFGEVEKRRFGSAKSLDATAGDGRGSISIESYSGDINIRTR